MAKKKKLLKSETVENKENIIEQIIKLKLSNTGIPYLDFGDAGYISFCRFANPLNGYTHLNFSCIRKGSLIERESFLADMEMTPFGGQNKNSIKAIKIYSIIKQLRLLFKKYTNKEGIFLKENIDKLAKDLPNIKLTINDTNSTTTRKFRTRKKKALSPLKKEKEARKKAKAKARRKNH